MKFRVLSDSESYFEISSYVLRGSRLEFAKVFLGILAAFPLALLCKVCRTLWKGAGVLANGFFLALTLGSSSGLRESFVSKVSSFAANLADWILFPFAVATCLSRLLLAVLIHPTLFIRY